MYPFIRIWQEREGWCWEIRLSADLTVKKNFHYKNKQQARELAKSLWYRLQTQSNMIFKGKPYITVKETMKE